MFMEYFNITDVSAQMDVCGFVHQNFLFLSHALMTAKKVLKTMKYTRIFLLNTLCEKYSCEIKLFIIDMLDIFHCF